MRMIKARDISSGINVIDGCLAVLIRNNAIVSAQVLIRECVEIWRDSDSNNNQIENNLIAIAQFRFIGTFTARNTGNGCVQMNRNTRLFMIRLHNVCDFTRNSTPHEL